MTAPVAAGAVREIREDAQSAYDDLIRQLAEVNAVIEI